MLFAGLPAERALFKRVEADSHRIKRFAPRVAQMCADKERNFDFELSVLSVWSAIHRLWGTAMRSLSLRGSMPTVSG